MEAPALQRLRSGDHFDIIFCDLMMPELTGMDLFAELSKTHPEVTERIIFLTGGVFTPRANEFLTKAQNLRIEKPFDMNQLITLVRDRMK